jgi:hypothetical protein
VEAINEGPGVLAMWISGAVKELGAALGIGGGRGRLILKSIDVAPSPSGSVTVRKKTAPLLRSCVIRPFQRKEPPVQFSAPNIISAIYLVT